MDTERSGLDEAMDVGSSTISHLKSLKTAATFSKAGYGAALGGPFSAAIGAVIANRNQFAKILLVILSILLLPVLFIVMLPGLIFGSLTEQSDVLNSNSMISENIRASRDAIVEVLEESHEDILAEIHAAISRLPQGDTASINDPYTYSISVNANLLISQFCASQDDYKNINLNQLKKLIRENKEGLFSYDVATETGTGTNTDGYFYETHLYRCLCWGFLFCRPCIPSYRQAERTCQKLCRKPDCFLWYCFFRHSSCYQS